MTSLFVAVHVHVGVFEWEHVNVWHGMFMLLKTGGFDVCVWVWTVF